MKTSERKNFTQPEIEILYFGQGDVVMASGVVDDAYDWLDDIEADNFR